MKKESFIIYKSFYEPIKKLKDQNLGILFRALFLYQITGEEPPEDSDILMPFEFFKNQFKLDAIKYEKVVDRNQKNGLKGGRPRTQENPNNPTGYLKPKQPDNVNDNVNDKVTVTVKEKEKVNVKGLEERKLAFADSIKIYIEDYNPTEFDGIKDKYPKPMLLEFFEYWAEHGDNDKKMRFEKQTSFSVQRRLKTWAKNENKFNKTNNNNNKAAGKVDDDYIQELKARLS
tara:strand:- start:654 stop:1343 length:690 start_codon:yes stop_codon:yes gene_type:complete